MVLDLFARRRAGRLASLRPREPTQYTALAFQRLLRELGVTVRFGRRLLFLATPLEGYDVGLDEVDDGIWSIYFCNVLIARFDERKYVIRG